MRMVHYIRRVGVWDLGIRALLILLLIFVVVTTEQRNQRDACQAAFNRVIAARTVALTPIGQETQAALDRVEITSADYNGYFAEVIAHPATTPAAQAAVLKEFTARLARYRDAIVAYNELRATQKKQQAAHPIPDIRRFC